jgi:hypothetical protein
MEESVDKRVCRERNALLEKRASLQKRVGRRQRKARFSLQTRLSHRHIIMYKDVKNDLIEIAEEIEERFYNEEEGIFTTFKFQRFVQQTFIRDGEDDN